MFETSPSPTPTHSTTPSSDSASFPGTISERNSIDEGNFPIIQGEGIDTRYLGRIDQADQVERKATWKISMDGSVKPDDQPYAGAGQGLFLSGHTYDSSLGDMNMEAYADDTPLASNSRTGHPNEMSFFNRNKVVDNQPYLQINPNDMYNQTIMERQHVPVNNNARNGQYMQPVRPPVNVDVKSNIGQYGIGMGEAGPSSFTQQRPSSRGTVGSTSVSPVLARHGHFNKLGPLSSTIPGTSSMPPPSPMGQRIGLTDGESDYAKSAPSSLKKSRRTAKPRSSIASTSSVGDIGANFAGMGLINDNGAMSGGMGMRYPYGMPYSAHTSTLPTPTGSNEDDESYKTKHWKVVHPPPAAVNNLPLFIHGIKNQGAKSRVETQIKMKITIARPTSGQMQDAYGTPYPHQMNSHNGSELDGASPFERVGTYKAVKIRAGMGARRRARKGADKGDPESLGAHRPEEVLFLYTEVWCTDHPVRAFACARCVNRERKRAQARAPIARKSKAPSESDEQMYEAANTSATLDATSDPVDEEGLTQEDKERILLFNCGPLVELVDGECDLPARLTCYCRHHKEKSGFRVVFNLRDHTGRLVCSGTTPPVMITDDHKTPTHKGTSVTSALTDGGVSASSKGAAAMRSRAKTKKIREASASTDEDKKSTVSKKVHQAKPYDRRNQSDAKSVISNGAGISPRGSFTPLGLSMTPLNGRSVPGSPLPMTGGRNSYFMSNGLGEPGSGAISPSLVMGGGHYEGQNSHWQNQSSPAGLTAALPAISQQLSQWAASNGQAQTSSQEADVTSNINAMQLDDQTWQFKLQDQSANILPSADFAHMMDSNASHFHLQQPNFSSGIGSNGQQHLGLEGLGRPAHMEMISSSPSQRMLEPEPDFESMLNFSPQSSASPLPQDFASPTSDLLDTSTTASAWSPIGPQHINPAQFMPQPHLPVQATRPRPAISRLVPAEGPTHGGVEVTILGENFHPGMVCMFGAFPAVTVQSYGPTTLVCLLPPNPNPGPVHVQVIGEDGRPVQLAPGQQPAVFTYNDTTDRKLMEMALTAVGLRVTGQVVGAVEIARRIMGGPQSGDQQGQSYQNGGGNGGTQMSQGHGGISAEEQHLADELASAIYSNTNKDVQAAVIRFLVAFLPIDARSRSIRRKHPGQTALNHVSAEGQTLLHLASLLGFTDLVHLLIRADATVDIHDRNGYTAYIFAAMAGHAAVARLLLAAGAREASCTFSNQTAATLAHRAGHGPEYATIYSHSRRMQSQTPSSSGPRRSSMTSESSIDHDNPSSATDNDSLQEDIWTISPNRLTTPADIMAVREPGHPAQPILLPKSKHQVRTETDAGNLTPRASRSPLPPTTTGGDHPPPYMAVDNANWLQRTLSHLPQSRGMPPAPHIKDFIPPALWEKLPSAQVFVPQMPQMPTADSQWGAQTWLAMPMSAFMAAISRTGVESTESGNQVQEPSSRRADAAAMQRKEEIARQQAIQTAQSVGTVDITAPVAIAPKRKEARLRRPKEASSRLRFEQSVAATPPARRSNANTELQRPPAPAKVDKMLFLFWLPVLAIAFVYTIVTSLPYTIGRALLGPLVGPLTKLLQL